MKKILMVFMLAFAMIMALPYCNDSAASAQTKVKITGNGVRLRTSPSTYTNNVYTQLNAGAVVDYISTEGDWYCVKYNGRVLYVSRDFASLSKSAAPKQAEKQYNYCVVNAKNLRLRVGPGTEYNYLVWTATGKTVHLDHGDVLTYLGETRNGFCKVKFDGKEVWVAKEFVKMK